ncbi:sperm-associated antigen 8 [Rhea pennata]|uniref:sperm-associated antigen 8 n=1 Tax=Rhea pennata TaxID=8795 RepID=UPI002E258D39
MEPGARRGPETPRGVALTGHVPPPYPGERPLRAASVPSEGPVPEVADEKPFCDGETLVAAAATAGEALPAPSNRAGAVPPAEVGKEPRGLELPPCRGTAGPCVGEPPPSLAQTLPVPVRTPAEQPSQPTPRGSCLVRNWQEERATNDLDHVPRPELGSEGFFYRHGHRGLLTHQLLSQLADSTTMKDAYRQPWRTALPARGQREAMLEFMLYQKYRKEMLEEICPPPGPMESVSTTHRDYCAEGFQPTPLPPTQPHDCYTEQPRSYWLEQAHSVPGVTSIHATNAPFRRNAAFSTPIMEYLGQPLP